MLLVRSFIFTMTSLCVLQFAQVAWAQSGSKANKKIVLYTHQKEELIGPLSKAFTEETGIQVEFLTGQAGPLIERIKAEGRGTSADIFNSADVGTLWQASQAGILAPVKSEVLTSKIPANFRAPNNEWFGFTRRARVIYYNKEKLKNPNIKTYADLAKPEWKGKLCLRSSGSVYSQSLVGTLIAQSNEAETEKVVQGWVNNLAGEVFDSDSKLIEAVDSGRCLVGVANTYYYARLLRAGKVPNVAILFPSPAHINISGMGLTKHAKHPKEAVQFLEWLTSDKAQKMYAELNLEYPVVSTVQPDAIVAAWGVPNADTTPLVKAGELQTQAVKLMDRSKYK